MNMKNKTRLQAVLRWTFAGAALLAMILEILAFAVSYQLKSNYFDNGAILPTLAAMFAVIAAIAGTVDAWLTKSALDGRGKIRFASAPAAVGFAVAGIHLLTTAVTTLGLATACFLILAALYGVLDCVGAKNLGPVTTLIGFAAVLGCAGLTGYHYFDHSVEMNASGKLLLQTALLCAMLFFTGELRCLLGTPTPRIYRMLTVWTISSGALASLPVIFACISGKIDRTDYLTCAILILGMTATAIIRYVSLLLEARRAENVDPII